MRSILHVDFDSFFASCEQHFNPNLRGKPIGITAENGRNCVIAASREAKKLGVKSPNTTWEAKRICPEIQFVKADLERYLEITKKLLSIATFYSPVVELFSLDEVFIDLTCVSNLYPDVFRVVRSFKKRLADEIGSTITVSMGVSHNKLLAKLATSLNKPDGFAMIDSSNKNKILSQIELTDIMGIGERYKRRLNMLGVFNFYDLQNYPMYLLKAEFGNVASQNLKALSFGIDDSPVVSYTEDIETKSVGRNYCLPSNNYDNEEVLKIIRELCEEIAIKLRRLKMKGRTIELYLHGAARRGSAPEGNEQMGTRKTISRYTNQGSDIFEICSRFFNKYVHTGCGNEATHPVCKREYVRQVSIYVSNLIDEQYTTASLFENPKNETIARLVDAINDRFGHHTVRRGYLVSAPKLPTRPNGYMADRWQRKEIRGLEISNHL